MQILSTIWAAIVAHPAIAIPIVTMLVSLIFRDRTDEELAKLPRFVAVPLRAMRPVMAVVAAMGFDGPAVIAAFKSAVAKKPAEPKVPEDVPTLRNLPPLPVLAFVAFALLAGCSPSASSPSSDPRATARAVYLTIADGLVRADHICADVARAKSSASTAVTCAGAVDVGRDALLATQAAVDSWEDGGKARWMCAALKATSALHQIGNAISAAGASLPPPVVDALALGDQFVGMCKDGGAP
jgi:hypothetical protein